jgi:hypothetical protein
MKQVVILKKPLVFDDFEIDLFHDSCCSDDLLVSSFSSSAVFDGQP